MKKIILSITLTLLSLWGYGQPISDYYAFLQGEENYSSLNLGSAAQFYFNQNVDDNQIYQAIGFDFNYNGQTYDHIYIGTNGATSFTSSVINMNNDLSDTSSQYANIIAPLWDDLYIRSADGGYIATTTTGTAPHRTFSVEWHNISWRNTGNTVSFKMVLEETTDNIYFYYGQNNSTDSRSASIGIKNDNYGQHSFISVTPESPASASITTVNNNINVSNYPGENTFYAFKHKTYVPDDNLEAQIENVTTISDGVPNYVLTKSLAYIQTTDFSNKNINDATGVEDFYNLKYAYFSNNNLDEIHFYKWASIEKIYLSSNNITNFYFPNQETSVTAIRIDYNPLIDLDLSTYTSLTKLWCNNSLLETLNVQNGNNTNITEFHAAHCPNLTCIVVDDNFYSRRNWDDIDPQASFSLNCHYGETYVPDDNFEHYLETHTANGSTSSIGSAYSMGNGVDNDNYVTTANIENVINLDVHDKSIADLTGIADFTRLSYLSAYSNQLTNLNLNNNLLLNRAFINNNLLTTINVSGLVHLTELRLQHNQLTAIDISQNTALSTIDFGTNQLTNIDLSNNTQLINISLPYNNLTQLDLSMLTQVETIDCNHNNLGSLNIKNGHNGIITEFLALTNPNLTCIQVDDATYSTNNWTNIDATASFNEDCSSLLTYIPDTNFEAYLEAHGMGNGVANDHYVTTANIDTVTNLDIHYQNITDLTGIEDFAALQILRCYNNADLVSIDVSQNSNLQILDAHGCNLNSINIGTNNNLTSISAGNNVLTNFMPGNCPNLTSLTLRNNQLTTINLGYYPQLETLDLTNNPITDLYLDNNTALKSLTIDNLNLNDSYLDLSSLHLLEHLSVTNNNLANLSFYDNNLLGINCSNNNLTQLDLSEATEIINIACSNNQITELLISEGYYGQSDLMYLFCDHNQITELDLSGLETLEEIECQNNQLTLLNISNGNNSNMGDFDATGNPDLSCVQVDDETYMNANWQGAIDSSAAYSNACHTGETYIPDENFEAYLETHRDGGGSVSLGSTNSMGNGIANDHYVTTSKINTVINLDVSNQNISDLTGLTDFVALQLLNVSYNHISTIDVSPFNDLIQLRVVGNQLSGIDVSNNTNLYLLDCSSNPMNQLDISDLIDLGYLLIYNTHISNIDLSHNTDLYYLDISFNDNISSVDLSHNTILHYFYCQYDMIDQLDFSNNITLKYLNVSNNQLNSLNLDAVDLYLERLDVRNNQLSELFIQNGKNDLLSGTYTENSNTYARFRATGNPALTCIYVDNATDANNGTGNYQDWEKDDTASYVTNATECDLATRLTYVPDDNFEDFLEANGIGNGIANDDYVSTANIENIANLDISGRLITDLTGIEDFTALMTLHAEVNNISSIDISSNVNLKILYLNDNQLSNIDLSHNLNLITLNISDNLLTSVDISHNTNLISFYCNYNQLTSIDLSNNINLTHLNLTDNQINNIDLSANTMLVYILVFRNDLTNLNVQNGNNANITDFNAQLNPNLTCIQVDDPNASYLSNWHKDSTAHFSDDCSIAYYDLTVNTNGNGSVVLNPTGDNYQDGTSVALTATADAGWQFTGWSGDLSGNTNPATITMDSDKTVTATFTRIQYTLDVSTYGNGSVSLSPVGGTYNAGTVVTVTATPDAGWQFDGWDGSVNTSDNPVTITMDSNKSLVASFSQIQHTLTVSTSGNGSVALSPTGGTYNEGDIVTLTATPDAGWEFTGWSGDMSGNTNPATITIDSNKTVTATFTQLAQTYVPDDNFEAFLEANGMGNGIANDDHVFTSNIENITSININNQNIVDLTGIEDFTALQQIYANENQLTQADFSNNINLDRIECNNNLLTSINISQNIHLMYLELNENNLTDLDISQNTQLTELSIESNQLTSLSLSNNSHLSNLDCNHNQLTSLDITHNTLLVSLNFDHNNISSIDLSQNAQMSYLVCFNNQLSSIDVSNLSNLVALLCNNNQITSVDVSQNHNLAYLWVQNNQLTELDVRNTNNGNLNGTIVIEGITQAKFRATDNPNLSCIYVDNPTDANNGSGDYLDWQKDVTTIYTANATECNLLTRLTYVPDDNFEAYLEANAMGNGIANDDFVSTANIENVTNLDVHNQNIADLTGIEDFASLSVLNANNNQLSQIDLSQNIALTRLDIDSNQLTDLDLSHNTLLTVLNAGSNQLTNIDLSSNTQLVHLAISNNQLSSIDLSYNTQLNYILLYNNQLTSFDAAQNTLLETFNIRNNQLTDLNVQNGNNAIISYFEASANPNLTCIQVDDPSASYLSSWHKDSTANYSDNCSIVYHDLTTNIVGNGSVSPSNGTYIEGAMVTLTATPDTGWEFTGWSGDLSGNTNPATITMDSDKTITATFTQIQHTLNVNATGNGSVALSPIGGIYNEGTTVTLTATPDTGWEFAGWSGDLSGNTNPATITMDSDKTVTAIFTEQTPDYCYSYGNTTFQTSITQVQFNTIDNATGKDTDTQGNAYSDFTNISTDIHRESIYNLNIQVNTAGNYTVKTKVWIDWNQDLDFDDAGEEFDLGTANNVNDGLTSLSPLAITIPANAVLGNTRMRVVTKYYYDPVACGQGFDGEVEDYNINVQEALDIENYYKNLLSVYPNPVNDVLHIKYKESENVEIYIYNLMGQELIHQSSNNGFANLNLKSLPVANYVLMIAINQHHIYYNLIKE